MNDNETKKYLESLGHTLFEISNIRYYELHCNICNYSFMNFHGKILISCTKIQDQFFTNWNSLKNETCSDLVIKEIIE